MQTWTQLVVDKAVPKKAFVPLVDLALGRAIDKSAQALHCTARTRRRLARWAPEDSSPADYGDRAI